MGIIWTLCVDDLVTVHASREAALASLRVGREDYAPEDDADLVAWVRRNCGVHVMLVEHELPVPTERERHAATARTARLIDAEWAQIRERMTLPSMCEMGDVLALRRLAQTIVALPQPGDPRAEFYVHHGGTDEAVRQVARFFSRDHLMNAARLRGITDIRPRATRTDLARALVYLGAAWFGELDTTGGPYDGYDGG